MSRKQRRAQRKQNKSARAPQARQAPLDPASAQAAVQQARQRVAEGRFNDARLIYQRLVSTAHATPALYAEACKPLVLSGALAHWEALALQATERFPNHPVGWLQLGQARQNLGHPETAREAYRHALERDPGSAEAWAGLAQVHERLHELDDALEAIDKAISLKPEAYFLRYCRGIILRRLGRADESLDQQRQVLDDAPESDSAQRHRAWLEIAALKRQAGEHEAARQAVAKAKDVQAPLREPYADAYPGFQHAVAQRYDGLDARLARAWHQADPAGAKHLGAGQVFLVGHPRSGTTLTEQVLAAHPRAVTLDEREMFVHAEAGIAGNTPSPQTLDGLAFGQRSRFCQAYREQVERYLGEPVGERVVVDKRPDSLLLLPSVLRFMPTAKAVVVLRDPRDVCTSCYEQAFSLSVVSAQFGSIASTCRYYAWFMSQWLKLRAVLPDEMWREVRYEDLVSDFEPNARELVRFVGLPWDDAVLSYNEKATARLVSTPSYEAVTKPVTTGAVGRWRAYVDEFAEHGGVLAPYLKAFGYDAG